jgi:hypothetical protein
MKLEFSVNKVIKILMSHSLLRSDPTQEEEASSEEEENAFPKRNTVIL